MRLEVGSTMTYSSNLYRELELKLWPDPDRSEEDGIDEQEHALSTAWQG